MRLFDPKLLCLGTLGALSAFAAVQPVATLGTATLATAITRQTVSLASTSTNRSTTQLATTRTTPTSTVASTTKNTTTIVTSTPKPTDILKGPRTVNMLADIKGFYDLPQGGDVIKNATLNGTNIQCDILVGMRKKMETFYFFAINDVPAFKKHLHIDVMPMITDVIEILNNQPVVALNVAFTKKGLVKLGIMDNMLDIPFTNGQKADATNLGDQGTSTWVPEFASDKIHGVFIIASDQQPFINAQIQVLEAIFTTEITKIYQLDGQIRPPPFEGHEMFGYLDGISQPAVAGFNINPIPGQQVINAGVILVGEVGDTLIGSRPPWTKDGSFMVFRQLKQLVPEFNKFLWNNAPTVIGMNQAQSADLLGARMVGRWKSGAPIDLTPLADNPALGANPLMNNNFDFFHAGFPPSSDETHCPFSAHIRKSWPRSDQPSPLNAIMRAGIPYGPELTSAEIARNASSSSPDLERGLAFVSYQSRIDLGFRFIQRDWENNPNFPFGKVHAPGHDPISGQNNGNPRFMAGYDIDTPNAVLNLPFEFVISRGGDYFFSPSIDALQNKISV